MNYVGSRATVLGVILVSLVGLVPRTGSALAPTAGDRIGREPTYGPANPLVDLGLEPSADLVPLGQVFGVRLIAQADSTADQAISSISVALQWEAAHITLLGVENDGPYAWLLSGFPDDSGLDDLNNTFLDGDAFYLALSSPAAPAAATPQGLHVTTFLFEAKQQTSAAQISIVPSLGSFTRSEVAGADFVGQDVTGRLGTVFLRVCIGEPGDLDNDGTENCLDLCPDTPTGGIVSVDGCSCSQITCNDGLFCNGVETCLAGECQTGIPPVLDDSLACTIDRCDEENDQIVHTTDDGNCDDFLFCTGIETCDLQLGCQAGDNPCADPSQPHCDEDGRACVECLVDADCDDGAFCDGAETCLGNACQAGIPPVLSDGVACTIDRCDEENDQIVHTADDGDCDDFLFCTGIETCDLQLGCQAGAHPCADPLEPHCDEEGGVCVECLVDADCDDGAFCDGAESCLGNACQAGNPPVLDDGVACTIDTCDEESDQIVHTADDGDCDDGLFCTGIETCDSQLGCQAGDHPCADPSMPDCDGDNRRCRTQLVASKPANDSTLPRVSGNCIELEFSAPNGGHTIMINELLADGNPATNLASSFDVTVEGSTLTFEDRSNTLRNKTWYRIHNGNGSAHVAPFAVDFVVVFGDVNGSGDTDVTDVAQVLANRGGSSACSRFDLNGSGGVDVTDVAVALANRGSTAPPKP